MISIDLGIVVGSYATVALCAFMYHWWRMPAVIDEEKQAKIDAAVRLIGGVGTLHRAVFETAERIRDFIAQFIANNGEMPKSYPTSDVNEQIRMATAVSEWCNRFTRQFRANLSGQVEDALNKIQAEGIALDFSLIGVLKQATLTPNSVMLVAGVMMAGALSLTLKKK